MIHYTDGGNTSMGSSRDWIPSREEALASLMVIWIATALRASQ
jgi:hypothetical protein